jgi:hypothetical protein
MQQVSCPNLSGINLNHRNNVLIVATDISDIINARCYCDSVIFILKWTLISHIGSIFYVLYMYKKANEIIFSIQLVSCPNLSKINGNYQNNVFKQRRALMTSTMFIATMILLIYYHLAFQSWDRAT